MKLGNNLGVLLLPLALLPSLQGCSSKSASRNPSQWSAAAEYQSEDNPIILEEEYEAQQRGEVTFDIPITRNASVEKWLAYFQGRGRKWFHVWMERSGRYVPFMRKILRDHDLPEDLVYLAMIESGFSARAYSRARAVGPWQFIKSTGRLYGLRADFWVDERRDPEKSTVAAARHLKDLYDQFQSWKLAAAAYNAGAAKVSRAIRRYRTEDFWELTKGRYLKPETRNYVPKMIAAALIAKEPEKYGFTEIEYQDPLSYDKIIIEHPVNLHVLAKKANYDVEDLLRFNPELNHAVTPPDAKSYELRVPSKTSELFLQAYHSLSDDEKFQYAAHKVSRGDTLAALARRYRVPVTAIKDLNQMRSNLLRVGQMLLIPVPAGAQWAARRGKAPARDKEDVKTIARATKMAKKARSQSSQAAKAEPSRKVHVVRRGESLWSIAQRYGISVLEIKNENRLRRNQIVPGKRLYIPQG